MFPFMLPENTESLWLSDVSKGLKINIYRNCLNLGYVETKSFYNPSVLKTNNWENRPIYLTFGILNSVFSALS